MNEANAKRLLFAVADALERAGAEFILYGGTLLGAVRERAFIQIDKDVDLAMKQEDFDRTAEVIGRELAIEGIRSVVIDHRHRRIWERGPFAIKFSGFGEKGDIGAFHLIKGRRAIPSHTRDYWLAHDPRFLDDLGDVEFYGRRFKCPKDCDAFLTEKYGDWRKPHRTFYNVSKPTCRMDGPWMK